MDENIELESWDNKCYICGKEFQTGSSYRFIGFAQTTHVIHVPCENTLKLVIKELRNENLALIHETTHPA